MITSDFADDFVSGNMRRVGGFTLTQKALDLCEFVPGAHMADIGCGKGATVRYLRVAGYDAHGLDCNAAVITPAEPNCQIGDALALPYATDSMEGLFYECSLSQMAEPHQVLCEGYRVLKEGGKLIVSDIYARNEGIQMRSSLMNRNQWLELFTCANFTCQFFEDRSEDLKALSAQLLWKYGYEILKEVYGCCDAAELKTARCGYFLMIAKRN